MKPFGELSSVWQTCLEQAWEAFVNGSLPIGAVIVGAAGQVLAVGRNRLGESGEHAPPTSTARPISKARPWRTLR